MKTANKFYKWLNYTLAAFLFAAAMLSTAAAQITPSASSKTQLMFVQSAEDLKVDAAKNSFRLVNVNQQTLYFSDRPQRIAGHLKMADYLAEWAKAEGPDNFSSDPPNAILSVYEPGQPDSTVVVVKISHPVVDGNDLVYSYKVIKGTIPSNGGATALFIDSIGVGGGAGAGFHGVGVGGRGAGVR
ncbi:MAG TPA: hypothetical protein VII23_23985 [Terriglobales bacterium]